MLDRLKNEFLFFDGAMGTMLQLAGLKAGELPEIFNIERPELITKIHKEYLEAGADFITTNTFGANRLKLEHSAYSVSQIVEAAVSLAGKAINGAPDKYIALDIGPIGTMLSPLGTISFDEAYDIFKEQVVAGVRAGADAVLIETMSDLYEVKAAILAVKENSELPLFCTMTFADEMRTFTGTDVLTMVNVVEGLGVDALGVNCSLGPAELQPVVKEMLRYATVPVLVQPNAGLPQSGRGLLAYDVLPEQFSREIALMADCGVSLFGGCCGTNPEYIKVIKERLKGQRPAARSVSRMTACSSSTKTVVLGTEVKIIGERINPSGKKMLKDALRNHDMDYVLKEALVQNETGADILDVNVGLPGLDEKMTMLEVIREIQNIIALPLQIDSSDVAVIEAALRFYNGKPIVNSVNGKQSNLEAVLPLIKKYGALVIGLTLDEEGIPKTAEQRLEIASRIIAAAQSYGIPEENVLIDPLVLTASAEQPNVFETLRAIPLIKEKFKVKVVLGTSNVSFGLPNRKIINTAYLAMALGYGLDAPITDPSSEALMDTIRSFRVLANQDPGCAEYIKTYSHVKTSAVTPQMSNLDLSEMIIKGLKDEAGAKTAELLKEFDRLDVVNRFIIPALDIVGLKYEKKEIFLPQLIGSAETAKKSFEIIKRQANLDGVEKAVKGKIILATVQGDIHDLGKNIVMLILENYGYDIIDLGKDVRIETVVSAVLSYKAELLGLSALMTTTVAAMEDTIKAVKQAAPWVKIMVGGAVLSPEYARQIGADYYAGDAREGVEIARQVFENQLGSYSV